LLKNVGGLTKPTACGNVELRGVDESRRFSRHSFHIPGLTSMTRLVYN